MRLFTSSTSKRLNEVTGFLLLAFGLLVLLGLASYHVTDPSWDTAAGPVKPQNLTGALGAYAADLLLQAFGAAAFLFPMVAFVLGWKWMRSEDIEAPLIKMIGFVLLFLSACAAAGLAPEFRVFEKAIPLGGATGLVLADLLQAALNRTGAIVVTATSLVVALYLVSKFSLAVLSGWLRGPVAWLRGLTQRAVARRKERAAAYTAAQVTRRDEARIAAAVKASNTRGKRPKTAIVEPGFVEPLLDELAPWEEEVRPNPAVEELNGLEEIPLNWTSRKTDFTISMKLVLNLQNKIKMRQTMSKHACLLLLPNTSLGKPLVHLTLQDLGQWKQSPDSVGNIISSSPKLTNSQLSTLMVCAFLP